MSTHHLRRTEILLAVATVLLLLPACSVNVKKDSQGKDKKVDIDTPVGGIHVSNDADVRDTGLPVYPGARLKKQEDDGDEKNANVNISTGFFALKVIAVEYETDDAPEKLISFYKGQLKKYGNPLECRTHGHGRHVKVEGSGNSDSKLLTCEDDGGTTVELKVGTRDNQRIVVIEPQENGASFALVRVQTHGKDTI